jgi:hypothetical protein
MLAVLPWVWTPTGLLIYTVVGLVIGALQSAMLWQCAFNTRYRFLGRVTRLCVIVGLLTTPLALYVMFKYPELLAP